MQFDEPTIGSPYSARSPRSSMVSPVKARIALLDPPRSSPSPRVRARIASMGLSTKEVENHGGRKGSSSPLRKLIRSRQQHQPEKRQLSYAPLLGEAEPSSSTFRAVANECITTGCSDDDFWNFKEAFPLSQPSPSDATATPTKPRTDEDTAEERPKECSHYRQTQKKLDGTQQNGEEGEVNFWLDPAEMSVCSSVTSPTFGSGQQPMTPAAASSALPTVLVMKNNQSPSECSLVSRKSVSISKCVSFKVFDTECSPSDVGELQEDTLVEMANSFQNSELNRGRGSFKDIAVKPSPTSQRGIDNIPVEPPMPPCIGSLNLSPENEEGEAALLADARSSPKRKDRKRKKNIVKRGLKAIAKNLQSEQLKREESDDEPVMVRPLSPVRRQDKREKRRQERERSRSPRRRGRQQPAYCEERQPLRSVMEAEQRELQFERLLEARAVLVIQASLRGHLVRIQLSSVNKLHHQLASIHMQRERELKEIETWKQEEMARIRREVELEVQQEECEWDEKLLQLRKEATTSFETIQKLQCENKKLQEQQKKIKEGCESLTKKNRLAMLQTSTLTSAVECAGMQAVLVQSNRSLERVEQDYLECIDRTQRICDEMDGLHKAEREMNTMLEETIHGMVRKVRRQVGLDHFEMFQDIVDAATKKVTPLTRNDSEAASSVFSEQ